MYLIRIVVFRDVPVAASDEDKSKVILGYDAAGNIVSIEVFDGSSRVEEPHKVTAETAGRVGLLSGAAVTPVTVPQFIQCYARCVRFGARLCRLFTIRRFPAFLSFKHLRNATPSFRL